MTTKKTSKPSVKKTTHERKRQTVGESIIQGLKEAIAWTEGTDNRAHVTLVDVTKATCGKYG